MAAVEQGYGDLTPTEQQESKASRNISISTGPNPINPLFARTVAVGPQSELETSRFTYKTLKYPLDVESNKRFGYYIKFDVLMNLRSKYAEKLSFGDTQQLSTLNAERQKFLENRYTTAKSAFSQESQSVKPTTVGSLFKSQTTKTQQSISLYMPDTLNWSFQNHWDETNISEKFGKAGMALTAGSLGASMFKNRGELPPLKPEDILKFFEQNRTATSGLALSAEFLGTQLGAEQLGLAAVGFALNPNIEVLYKQPKLREFQFEFIFAPRNKQEADTALAIIQMFKFHSAPEFTGAADLGRFYIPPSQFNIQFMGRDGELWQLGKVLPACALTNVVVNYTYGGKFSVFEDGTPTNIQLQLNFMETAFITKEDVELGY